MSDHTHHSGQTNHSEHGNHGRPYLLFWINMILGLIVMYVVMFSMIDGIGDFRNNLNMFYMALTMAAPMGILMLMMMGSMYRDKKLNAILYVAFALVFVLAFFGVRSQALIGDRQFLRSMIPHHSGAVLMCEEASISDPEIKSLCGQIIVSQKEEIAQMKAMLERR